jgi:hypothetical protein
MAELWRPRAVKTLAILGLMERIFFFGKRD